MANSPFIAKTAAGATIPAGTAFQPMKRPGQRVLSIWLSYLCIAFLTFPILNFVSIPHVPPWDQALAYLLLLFCTFPVAAHMTAKNVSLPVFPIVCLVYAGMYAIPVFLVPPFVACMSSSNGIKMVPEWAVREALSYSLLGVLAMQAGFWFFRFSLLHLLIPRVRLELEVDKAKRLIITTGSIGVLLIWLNLIHQLIVPDQYSYIAYLMMKQASLCVALLFFYNMQGKLERREKWFLYIVVVAQELLALASGNLRDMLEPLIVMGAVYWMGKRKFPWRYMVLAVLFFAIIQPIKATYRRQVWFHSYASNSIYDRLVLWGTLLSTSWSDILKVGQVSMRNSPTHSAMARTDIIHTFGRVIQLTPSRVPYQLGVTYNYLLYALIPRAIWPNKPSASSANQFFGVSYDFQTLDSVGDTSIGLPHLVESYINFGPIGVIFVMMILGMVYAAVDRLFDHSEAGAGGIAIYAVVLTNLWTIETATAPTFGALIQTIVVYTLLLRFVRVKGKTNVAPAAMGTWKGLAS